MGFILAIFSYNNGHLKLKKKCRRANSNEYWMVLVCWWGKWAPKVLIVAGESLFFVFFAYTVLWYNRFYGFKFIDYMLALSYKSFLYIISMWLQHNYSDIFTIVSIPCISIARFTLHNCIHIRKTICCSMTWPSRWFTCEQRCASSWKYPFLQSQSSRVVIIHSPWMPTQHGRPRRLQFMCLLSSLCAAPIGLRHICKYTLTFWCGMDFDVRIWGIT